ncbi:MAG: ATP-binding cassette domain-containing protein, partial [Bacilli bacterium]|nr:ATP-binding cassette domain-containing protein [Bacilli bacterium]
MQNVIEVRHLTKHYGSLKALDDLSFTVKQGEILGLLGPNGSGKSTMISCLLSLLQYDHGSIQIMGKEMSPDCYDIKAQ